MPMFCLDTSAASLFDSEKRTKDPASAAWLDANVDKTYLPTVVLAEVQYGIAKLRLDGELGEANRLSAEFANLRIVFCGRIASVDAAVALEAGQMFARARCEGEGGPGFRDCLIAATAVVNGWRVVTTNRIDFSRLGAAPILLPSVRRRSAQFDLPFGECLLPPSGAD
jgi:predicted nucleic acid-binding protein